MRKNENKNNLKETPMMLQYNKIKEAHNDAILFYRLGDFYEMFNKDAEIASKELGLTLTSRNKSQDKSVPLAGIPYHSAEGYISKLVKKGYKVVICEQTEDPKKAKGIVKREVVRIVTPGTSLLDETMSCSDNNFLASALFSPQKRKAALAYLDITTGEFYATEFRGIKSDFDLMAEVVRIRPSELIVSLSLKDSQLFTLANNRLNIPVRSCKFLSDSDSEELLCEYFKLLSLEGFGLKEKSYAVRAAAMLIETLDEYKLSESDVIDRITYYESSERMHLDAASIMNLEITETIADKEKRGSLLWVMDQTKTPMGFRMLKKWLLEPLSNIDDIQSRQSIVRTFVEDFSFRQDVVIHLEKIYDVERILSKAAFGSVNARDLLLLKQSLSVLPNLKDLIVKKDNIDLNKIICEFSDFEKLIKSLDMLKEDCPFSIREGGIIKNGYFEHLDAIREVSLNGKEHLARFEQLEKDKTGIKTLKVRYNRVFGYYIEVSKSYVSLIPDHYIRKQTLANCERFYTEELKQKESLILGAEEKIKNIEFELFQNIVSEVKEKTGDLKNMSHALSQIDCLVSFASVAVDLSWCCPKIKDEGVIDIHNGRHPVVDKILGQGGFVPNDTFMDDSQSQIHIITGPNMSGKSTYIRQVALISLLAHAGSFVPAKRARLDLVDRIFTRVGASDNLATGLSTFMVEMLETANILNNATSRSLVILDEIGRGTSTFDGISIAWAVTEFLHSKKTIGAKTLFATHYHELTELEKLLSRVVNYNVAVTEKNDKVTFLRKIVPGSTSKSYGIEVARLAGLPQNVIERAEDILTDLESSNDLNTEQSKYSGKNSDFKKTIDPENIKNESDKFHIKEKIKKQVKNENPEIDQLILFKTKIDPVIEELNQIDLMKVSPLQSLNFLFYLQKKIKGQPIPSPLPLSKGRSKIKFQETIQDQLNLKLF